jgi:alpha-tubulin suppressor-like RCC1 family protein
MRTHLQRILTAGVLAGMVVGCRADPNEPSQPTEPALASGTTEAALTFRQVTAGLTNSCGITTDNVAYCRGDATWGEVGNDTSATTHTGDYEIHILRPVQVAGGFHWRNMAPSQYLFTCGITTLYRAYCWGLNSLKVLGQGTGVPEDTVIDHPVPVKGNLLFRQLDASNEHVCGVTTDALAYCWGHNDRGQLGDGTRTNRDVPVLVRGYHKWRQVTSGGGFTCGITTGGVTFCWGDNRLGQLGDSSTSRFRWKPVRVAGQHQFVNLDAGAVHACAVTTAGKAFCWGDGRAGALGNGITALSFWPKPVSGGHVFKRVSAGGVYACGKTTSDQVFCWGDNGSGTLGDGTFTTRLTPVAVAGNLAFVQVWAGASHACATTAAGMGYCWGSNQWGDIGNGADRIARPIPTAVLGPE